MTERPLISTDSIESEIYADSIDNNFITLLFRQERQRTGGSVGPLRYIRGMTSRFDEIYKHDDYFRTGSKLSGSVRKLNGNTTVAAQSLQLPKDMSKEGVKAFIHDFSHEDEVSRTFGYVSLNEPGFPLFKPIKSETHGYIETTLAGKPLAVEAIGRYLNTPESFDCDFSTAEINEQINETYAAIRANMPSYDEFLKSMREGMERARQQEIYDTAHPEEAAARIAEENDRIIALPPIEWLPLN